MYVNPEENIRGIIINATNNFSLNRHLSDLVYEILVSAQAIARAVDVNEVYNIHLAIAMLENEKASNYLKRHNIQEKQQNNTHKALESRIIKGNNNNFGNNNLLDKDVINLSRETELLLETAFSDVNSTNSDLIEVNNLWKVITQDPGVVGQIFRDNKIKI